MMNKLLIAFAVLGMLLIAGCASKVQTPAVPSAPSEASPTTTQAVSDVGDGLSDVDSLDKELDTSELDSLDSDLASLG